MGQPLVILARADADPADGLAAAIGDETGRRLDRARERRSGPARFSRRRRVRPVQATDAEERAPAPFRVAALIEQGGEVAGSRAGVSGWISIVRSRISSSVSVGYRGPEGRLRAGDRSVTMRTSRSRRCRPGPRWGSDALFIALDRVRGSSAQPLAGFGPRSASTLLDLRHLSGRGLRSWRSDRGQEADPGSGQASGDLSVTIQSEVHGDLGMSSALS